MGSVGQKNTGVEIRVRRMLFAAGYRFRVHRKDLPGRPDLDFPSRRKVVFVHGCFWHGHGCPKGRLPKSRPEYWEPKIARNRQRDSEQVVALTEMGWSSLTVWECELKAPEELLQKLIRFLAGAPAPSQSLRRKHVEHTQTNRH